MKIREWLSSLDDLYKLYSGTVPVKIQSVDIEKDLDYLLFESSNQQDDAEKQMKDTVTLFLTNEYNGRVDRLLKSGIYKHPVHCKLMYAFYKYMNTLGKYRIHLFCDVPEMYLRSDQTFSDVYFHFRALCSYYECTLRPQAYTNQFPIDSELKDEFEHWKIYIQTEMCNDGYDTRVIWKKMVDLLCSLALMDTMLRDT